jgi:hypothetical protein
MAQQDGAALLRMLILTVFDEVNRPPDADELAERIAAIMSMQEIRADPPFVGRIFSSRLEPTCPTRSTA